MKKILSALLGLSLAATLGAQAPKWSEITWTEGSDLTMVGKLCTDTPNPYHRVDTVKYKGFTRGELDQVISSTGLALAFRTNSRYIAVKGEYGYKNYGVNTNGIALRGYDLYVKKDGKWLWASAACNGVDKEGDPLFVAREFDGTMKECLLYLPMYSELRSLQIGVISGSVIEKVDNPFRHRVGIFGSSFTHGISTSRAGMSYPVQFTRNTGIQMLSLGCSGNCRLQPYFADVLCNVDVDAFVFDSFSNPSIAQIEERLFPFIEKVQAAHPGIPLIFQHTIYREGRNFNTQAEKSEQDRIDYVDSVMNIAVKKYDDVYFIKTNATSKSHETSVDGVHPGDYGYTLWAESIEKQILKILRKYGLK
ncbi:MAG: SGNH/GDSL hydrolase family protein [Bacteroidales bacterium]|nr:SGNH/GDSL hydrolase family protein [Bacteroidales bacterium]